MSIQSIDEVVRAVCGSERHRFRELSDAILRDLDVEQTAALLSAYQVDGVGGATALLAVWLKGERRWVRIRPSVGRHTHVIEGISIVAGRWYSVSVALAERLRDEPASDMSGVFSALFEVESQSPALGVGENVEWVW